MTADPAWAPATADVAAHLRRYLRDEHGNILTDFTASTAITDTEAAGTIASTVAEVAGAAGPIPPELETSAAKTAAIGAAAEAVIDHDEEGRQLYRELRDLYEARLARLIAAAKDARDGTVDGISTSPASGSFPAPFGVDRTRF